LPVKTGVLGCRSVPDMGVTDITGASPLVARTNAGFFCIRREG